MTNQPAIARKGKLSRADRWLLLSIAAYLVMNGAQLWETAIIIPAWTQAPPASLIFFQGPYGLDFKYFWIIVHSIHEVIFILALVFNWKNKSRRLPLVLLFLAHVGVRVWTLVYFVPVIIDFQQMSVVDSVDPPLVERAAQWRNLNYLRVGLFFAINTALALLFNYWSKSSSERS